MIFFSLKQHISLAFFNQFLKNMATEVCLFVFLKFYLKNYNNSFYHYMTCTSYICTSYYSLNTNR